MNKAPNHPKRFDIKMLATLALTIIAASAIAMYFQNDPLNGQTNLFMSPSHIMYETK